MNRSAKRAASCLATLFLLMAVSVSARGETVREQVTRQLDGLEVWLATSNHGPGWNRFLHTAELRAELAKGEAADGDKVREILAQYTSGKPGLVSRRFVSVRRSLESWLAELTPPQPAALAETARAATDKFTPPTKQNVAQRKRALSSAAGRFDHFLRGGGKKKEQGWKKYLHWNDLLEQLGKADPDARALRVVELKFFGLHQGLELPVFDAIRKRLRDYTNGLIVADPRARAFYEKQLDALAKQLDAMSQETTSEQMVGVGRILGWLDMAGQARDLVAEVRRVYCRPNLHVEVSEALLQAGLNEKVRSQQPIDDFIMGTEIHGTADTLARISVHFVPDERQASIDFRIDGTAYSNNVGYHGPVTVYSSARSSIQGNKRILLDDRGFRSLPAEAFCQTASTIQDVAARFRIIENIAWRAALRQQPMAEDIGSRKTEQRVRAQIDAQAAGMLAKLNDSYRERFRKPLLRKDGFPHSLRFATSEDRLLMTMLQAGTFQVGASSDPPPLVDGLALGVRAHESLVGNFSEGLLGGETLSDAKLADLVEKLTGEVPEELRLSPDKEPWSITFAGSQPVTARFHDGQIRIAVRGSHFTRGEQAIDEPIEISAEYKVEKTPQGARLVREGDVQVEYLAKRSLGVTQVAFKKFMQTKFHAVFKPEMEGKGIELGERFKKVGRLHLEQLECDGGWALFGWTAPPPGSRTAKAPAKTTR